MNEKIVYNGNNCKWCDCKLIGKRYKWCSTKCFEKYKYDNNKCYIKEKDKIIREIKYNKTQYLINLPPEKLVQHINMLILHDKTKNEK